MAGNRQDEEESVGRWATPFSREGGVSLNILAGLTAGNFSAFWMGVVIVSLMSGAYLVSQHELAAVFSFGLVAFGFLGMGPSTLTKRAPTSARPSPSPFEIAGESSRALAMAQG